MSKEKPIVTTSDPVSGNIEYVMEFVYENGVPVNVNLTVKKPSHYDRLIALLIVKETMLALEQEHKERWSMKDKMAFGKALDGIKSMIKKGLPVVNGLMQTEKSNPK